MSRSAGTRGTFVEQARRRQIVDCTVAVVARDGFAAASLAAIAREAGISKPAVLYHFADKDELMTAVVTDVLGQFVAEVGGPVDAADGPAAALRAYVSAFLGYLGTHPEHIRFLVAGGSGAGGDDSRTADVARLIAGGVEVGEFTVTDPRVAATLVNGALDGVVGAWLADPGFDLAAARPEVETLIARMVGAG